VLLPFHTLAFRAHTPVFRTLLLAGIVAITALLQAAVLPA